MNPRKFLHKLSGKPRYSSKCPTCGVNHFDDDHTKAVIEIPHKDFCLYRKGNVRIKFNIVDHEM